MFKEASHLDSIPQVKNKNVLQAYHKLEQHNWSQEEKEAYIASKIDDDIEKSNLKHAKEEGKEEGEYNKAIEIAKAMLLDGDSIEKISRITGLPITKIENLKS